MLKPGTTPKQLIEDTIEKNRKKRKKSENSFDNPEISELIERICSIDCRDEAIFWAIKEAKNDPSKTIVECLRLGLEEWDK